MQLCNTSLGWLIVINHMATRSQSMVTHTTCGLVVYDNQPSETGVTQLQERHRLESNRITPAESGFLSNTTTTYILTFIMYVEL